jgi:hypothetical protein
MDIVATRRKRLRHLIDTSFDGLLVSFVQRTGISPSELSGLLRNKSFGEKKARLIELRAGLPPMYLDMPSDTHSLVHQIMELVSRLSEEEQRLVLAFCQMASKKKNSSLDESTDNRQRRRRMRTEPIHPSEDKRKNPERRKDEEERPAQL